MQSFPSFHGEGKKITTTTVDGLPGVFSRSKEEGGGVVVLLVFLSFGFHGWGKLQAEKDQDIISVLRMA
jgi:hypothetical protein